MMTKEILLGFEVDWVDSEDRHNPNAGKPVMLPLHHTTVTGMTQLSGKTTTLEALVQRGKITAITFLTKRGESGFKGQREIPPYFREQKRQDLIDWQYVEAILEATMGEKMKFERSWIIDSCKGDPSLRTSPAHSLEEVYNNIRKGQEDARRALDQSVFTNLSAYFEIILPQIKAYKFTDKLELKQGFNVMNLIGMKNEMQQLVIESVISYVLTKLENVVIVLPEAQKFIPEGKKTPVKGTAVRYIQEGAVLGNYMWFDSMPGYEAILCRIDGRVHALTFETLFNLPAAECRTTDRGELIRIPSHNVEVPGSDGHELVWRPLKYIIAHDYSGKLLQINAVGGLIDVSPNHPVMKYPRYLVEAEKLNVGDRLCSREFKKGEFTNGGAKGRILFVGTLDLAWLYGLYAAEGWPEGIANSDKTKIDKARDIIRKNFHIKTAIIEREGVYTLWFGSPRLTDHFQKLMYLPRTENYNSNTKWVPPEILNAHDAVRQAFIEGYEDGNGHFDEERDYTRSIVSNSRALILGIDYMKRKPYSIHIRDDKSAIQLAFNKSVERRKSRDEIKKIHAISYQGKLYDIEVGPNNHTFYMGIGNIRVHNTQVTTTVDKNLLKQCGNWIMGYQQERNEVDSVRDNVGKDLVKEEQITSLKLGHFMALLEKKVYHVYVLPAGVSEDVGRAVALGKMSVQEVRDRLKSGILEKAGDHGEGHYRIPIGEEKLEGWIAPQIQEHISELEAEVEELKKRPTIEEFNQTSEEFKQTIRNQQDQLQATTTELENLRKESEVLAQSHKQLFDEHKSIMVSLHTILQPILQPIVSDLNTVLEQRKLDGAIVVSPEVHGIVELIVQKKVQEAIQGLSPKQRRQIEAGETAFPWVNVWLPKLDTPQRKIILKVAEKYPLKLTKGDIAKLAQYAPGGGGFNEALRKLVRWSLLKKEGEDSYVLAEGPPG